MILKWNILIITMNLKIMNGLTCPNFKKASEFFNNNL